MTTAHDDRERSRRRVLWLVILALLLTGAAGVLVRLNLATTDARLAGPPPPLTQGAGSVTPDGNNGNQGEGNQGNGNGNGNNPGHPITVTGVVLGQVSPGSSATLEVTIANGNNQPILVTSVTGTVTAVTSAGVTGLPACQKSWYDVSAFAGSQPIAANSTGVVPLTVSLENLLGTNQDNCKGATYTFSYSAKARQA